MPGQEQFGKYTLLRKIATGGMAEIFLAKQAGFGDIERFVVIKRVLPHLTENPEFSRMFVDEMRTSAFLNHPNIVQIHDVGAVGDQYFIAMEYLEGRDLRRIMRKAAARGEVVPLGFAIRAISDICEGLHYAHYRRDNNGQPLNIIHRDVSPQNAMATVQGAVKLLDFGIAKAETQLNETRSGVLKGKYSYMSPEQATGQPLDLRSDIFAVGTILYELTTGRRLFKHPNEIVVLKMVADADVPPPRGVDSGYPPELERIVMKSLARRSATRYQTCRELQQDLNEFAIQLRFNWGPGEVGDYVAQLFEDERAELDPSSMPPPEVDDQVISFIEDAGNRPSAHGTPSFPSLLEQNVAAQREETSKTGSLSMLVQRARRRPILTVGVGLAATSVAVFALLLALLGFGESTSADDTNSVPNPLIQSTIVPGGDVGENAIVSFGTIQVESTPPGATIFIDGEEQEERTPLTVQAVTVGEEHFIVAELGENTAQARRITLNGDGDFQTVRFDFEQRVTPARIAFDDLPQGARVTIDGQNRERDNLTIEPSVAHTIVVTHRGEELLRREITPEPGQVVSIELPRGERVASSGRERAGATKVGTGTLMISSTPSTTVFLGRQSLGPTPTNDQVPSGSHLLRLVNRSLLINYRERVRVRPGQALKRSITIPQGTLRVSARPYAQVSINGANQGRTPLRKSLYAGSYSVTLTNRELGKSERRTVRISRGSDERIRVDWR